MTLYLKLWCVFYHNIKQVYAVSATVERTFPGRGGRGGEASLEHVTQLPGVLHQQAQQPQRRRDVAVHVRLFAVTLPANHDALSTRTRLLVPIRFHGLNLNELISTCLPCH